MHPFSYDPFMLSDEDVQRVAAAVVALLSERGALKLPAVQDRVCAYEPCGVAFTPTRKDQRYHSDPCRLAAFHARRRQIAGTQRRQRAERTYQEAAAVAESTLRSLGNPADPDPEIEALADKYMAEFGHLTTEGKSDDPEAPES